ncbi:MAG: hypothetical protein ACAH95_01160, partial [Fimbriimonas sp.]
EILRELRSHLWMSRQGAIVELELPTEEADRAAVGSLGSLELLAEDLIRRESGEETKSQWKLALVPGVLLLIAHASPFVSLLSRAYLPSAIVLCEWLTLIAFVAAVVRSRRWLIAPMAAWLLAATLLLGIGATTFMNRVQGNAGVSELRERYTRAIAGDSASLPREGGAYLAPVTRQVSYSSRLMFMPTTYVSAPEDRLVEAPMGTLAEAKAAWAKNGPAYLRQIDEGFHGLPTNARPVERAAFAIPRVVAAFSYEMCVFTTVNALGLLLVNRRRRRRATMRIAS